MDYPYVNIHSHFEDPEPDVITIRAYSIGRDACPHPAGMFCAGVHPWDADKVPIKKALNYLLEADAVAVGEIGLDFSCNVDRDKQKSVFEAQLQISVSRNLPVIIHCVKAYQEILNILREFSPHAVIFHGFTGSRQLAEQIYRDGWHISVGEKAFDSPKTLEAISFLPIDRLFAETDMYRISVKDVYEKIAAIRNIPGTELKEKIYENYKTIFG